MFKRILETRSNKIIYLFILMLLFSSSLVFDTGGPPLVYAQENMLTDNVGIGATGMAAKLQIKASGTGTGFALRIQDSTGADKISILDNGNVGIATTTPGSKLEVGMNSEGYDVKFYGATTDSYLKWKSDLDTLEIVGATGYVTTDVEGVILEGPVDVNGIITLDKTSISGSMDVSGNVGIGTTTPLARLQILGSGTSSGFALRIQSSTAADKFVILDKGNVGIGTTNPLQALEVSGQLKIGTYTLPSADGSSGQILKTDGAGNVSWGLDAGAGIGNPGGTDTQVQFNDAGSFGGNAGFVFNKTSGNVGIGAGTTAPLGRLQVGSSPSPALLIKADGKVGIGTTNPSYPFHIFNNLGGTSAPVFQLDVNVDRPALNISNTDTIASTYVLFTINGDNASDKAFGSSIIGDTYARFQFGVTGAMEWGPGSSARDTRIYRSGTSALILDNLAGGAASLRVTGGTNLATVSGNVGIGTTAPQGLLHVGTAPSSGLIVQASGNVGIGTTTPAEALDIWGELSVTGTIYDPWGTMLSLGIGDDININSGQVYVVASSGNVGIGTTLPTAKLHLLNVDTAPTNTLLIKTAGTTNAFALRIQDSQSADKVVILDKGNVGIGTTNPLQPLHVAGQLRIGAYTLPSTDGTSGQVLKTDGAGAVTWQAVGGAGGTPGGTDTQVQFNDAGSFGGNANFVFNKTSGNVGIGAGTTAPLGLLQVGTSPSPGLLVTASGNVGIGTTNPESYKLKVSGSSGLFGTVFANGLQILNAGSASNPIIAYNNNNDTGIYFPSTSDTMALVAGGAEVIRINGSNVGIGTSSPTKLLTVGGGTDAFTAGANGIGVNFAGGAGIFMRDSTNDVEGKYEVYQSRLGVGTITNHPFDLWTNNQAQLTILVGGNVGIGTTSPLTQLHIPGKVPAGAAGSVSTGNSPRSVYVQGRYAYVVNSTSSTLQVFDVSNPSSPVSTGSVSTGAGPQYVYVQGRYAYVANYDSDTLQVFDVSNPSSPVSTGSVSTGTFPIAVYVQGRYAYVANNGSGTLQVFDVSNPSSPVSTGSVSTGANPQSVYVQGRYAYVVNNGSDTLQVFDVSNPSSPVSTGSVSTGTQPRSVYVQGRYAYVVNLFSSTLQVFDVSNPSSPVSTGSVSTGNSPRSVYVQGRYAYVVNFSSPTLQVFDVSNPSSPVSTGSVSTGAGPLCVYVQGRYAYVVNYTSATLQVFDVGGAYIQQLEAGGIETGTLQLRSNLTVNNDADIRGGLVVGRGLLSQGPFAVTASAGTPPSVALMVNADGLVGIGTTAPTQKLHVAGQLRIGAYTLPSTDGTSGQVLKTDGAGNVTWQAAGGGGGAAGGTDTQVQFNDAGSFGGNANFVFNKTSGNVGIGTGTTAPLGRLQVGSSPSPALIIKADGNVGIGTTSPSSLLTLQGTNSIATLGSEMITNQVDRDFSGAPNWTGTNWSLSGGTWSHTAGANATSLSNSYVDPDPVSGNIYQIVFTVNTTTAGTLTPSFGGVNCSAVGGSTGTLTGYTCVVTAVDASALTFTPNANWVGTLDDISVKQITPSNALVVLNNSDAIVGLQIRSGGSALYNTFIGISAGQASTTGYRNTGLGYRALSSNITGYYNTAVGAEALYSNTIGIMNSAFGDGALKFNTGSSNSAFGNSALWVNTLGYENSAFGASALWSNTIGYYNSAVGKNALFNNTTGNYNSAMGWQSLRNTTGDGNTALGASAGRSNTTGTYNLFLGYNAGYTGTTNNLTNAIAIGYEAQVTQSNSLILGGIGAYAVNVGIGTSAPSAKLDILDSGTGVRTILQIKTAGTSSNFALRIQDSQSADKIVILDKGNVGIGTTNPAQLLEVAGQLKIGAYTLPATDGTSGQVLKTDGAGNVTWQVAGGGGGAAAGTDTQVQFNDAGSFGGNANLIFNKTSGRVGIGLSTTAPTARLEIKANGTTTGFALNIQDSLGANKLTLLDNGNLGIATTAPTQKLEVQGNILTTQEDTPIAKATTTANLSWPQGVYVSGKYAYVTSGGNNRLCIFDISNPSSIVTKATTTANFIWPWNVYVSGKYAYVTSYNSNGLHIFDISNPDSIVTKAYTSANLNGPIGVYVSGKYAYVANENNNRFCIFDISNPDSIVTKATTTANLFGPREVYVSGKYVYVTSTQNSRLCIFDISNPDSIIAKGYTGANLNQPEGVYVSGKYAYVASLGTNLFCIFDISNPDSILTKAYTNANLFSPRKVYVSGKYAYVISNSNSRLCIFDISNPDSIVTKATTSVNLNGPWGVYVSGKYAYVASYTNGRLCIFELNSTDTPNFTTGAAAISNLQVYDNAQIDNDLLVRSSLSVGQDALVQKDFSVEGKSYFIGNVGIGVGASSPAQKLHIDGQLKVGAYVFPSTDGTSGQVLKTDGAGNVTWQVAGGGGGAAAGTDTQVQFNDAGSFGGNANFVFNKTSGNVGIGAGTTAPLGLLQVGTSPSPGLLVTSGGNVGIGTTNPLAKLELIGSGTGCGAFLTLSDMSAPADTKHWFFSLQAGNLYVGTSNDALTATTSHLTIDTNSNSALTFLGARAGLNNQAQFNTYIGYEAGLSSPTASTDAADYNTAIGYQALLSNAIGGNRNSAVGYQALYSNAEGGSNSAIGYQALYSNTAATANFNSAVGHQALYSNISGNSNSAVGNGALYYNTNGYGNSAMGSYTLRDNTTGGFNAAMGTVALRYNTTGSYNSAMGSSALKTLRPTSKAITAFADNGDSKTRVTSAAHGQSNGTVVQISGTTNYNGSWTIEQVATDTFVINKVFVADDATGWWGIDTEGRYNTAAGSKAGYALITGSNNLFLGYQAGDALTTGSNNIVIGYDIDLPAVNSANMLDIGNLIYATGLTSTGTTVSTGNVGIGTTLPLARLHLLNTNTAPSDTLLIKTAGTTNAFALRIQDSLSNDKIVILDKGNVGIGTTDPLQLLHVAGQLRIGAYTLPSTDGTSGQVLKTDGAGALTWQADSGGAGGTPGGTDTQIQFNDTGSFGGNANFVFNKTSGNVGIGAGTTAPLGRLQVGSSPSPALIVKADSNVGIGTTNPENVLVVRKDQLDFTRIEINNANATGGTNVRYYQGATIVAGTWYDNNNNIFTIAAQETGSSLGLKAGAIDADEAITIKPAGKVGIGTTLPTARLHLLNTDTAPSDTLLIKTAGTTNAFALRIQDSLSADKVVVLDNGNLGIGTTNPAVKLHVVGASGDQWSNGILRFNTGTGAGTVGIKIGGLDGSGAAGYVWVQAHQPGFSDDRNLVFNPIAGNVGIGTTAPQGLLHVGTAPSSGLIVQASGNVGIGTTNPAQLLEVAGQLRIGAYTLPSTDGTSGQVLKTDGTGVVTWQADSGGAGGNPGGSNMQVQFNDAGSFGGNANFVFNKTSGNVGIGAGTTAPLGLLQVGTSPSPGLLVTTNGNVGIGTTSAGVSLQIGPTAPTQITASNSLMISGDLEVAGTSFIGPMEFAQNSGMVPWVDMSVSSTPSAGTVEGYTARVDATDILTVYAEANGTGGVQNPRVGIGTASPSAKLDIKANGTGSGFALRIQDSASADKVVILDKGNVGIGTTLPTQKLEVAGQLKIGVYTLPATDGTSGQVLKTDGAGAVTWQADTGGGTGSPGGTNTQVQFNDAGSFGGNANFVFNKTSGNVGIGAGTTAPTARLDVRVAGSSSEFALRISDTGPTDRLVVLANGNVGIGTTNPRKQLHVETNNSGTPTMIALYNTNTTDSNGATMLSLRSDSTGAGATTFKEAACILGKIDTHDNATYAGSLRFYTSVSGTIDERMRVENTGFVGIGDENPDALLEVSASGSASDLLMLSSNDANDGNRFIVKNSGNVGIGTSSPLAKLHLLNTDTAPSDTLLIKTAGTTNAFALRIQDSQSADKIVILDNGNVGIATTSPSEKLTISGGNVRHYASGNPTLLSNYDTTGDSRDVLVLGKYAYVADGGSGLQIIDISNPSSPVLVGTYDTPGIARGIFLAGKYAYVADDTSGMEILDVSDPTSPSLVGSVAPGGEAYRVRVSGKYAYLITSTAIRVIDVSDPASPAEVKNLSPGGTYFSAEVAGSYLYVSNCAYGTRIYDITDPLNPVLKSTFYPGTTLCHEDVCVSGKYAYIADEDRGLRIADISNPTSPIQVGIYDTNGYAYGVFTSGDYVYLADHNNGFAVFDVSSPTSPSLVGTYDTSGQARKVFISGKYAYVADMSSGLQIIDISGIKTPTITAGNINADFLSIGRDVNVNNSLYIRNSLNIGSGGVLSDGTLAFSGAGNNYFKGNLGIGTTLPSQKLEVAGQLKIGAYTLPSTDGSSGQVLKTDGAGAVTWQAVGGAGGTPGGTDTQVQFNDAGSFGGNANFVFNKTSGNVGIGAGTTAPTARLDVRVAGSSSEFALRISDTGPTDRLVVLANGNVGIGITTPQGLLHVGTAPSSGLIVQASGNVGIGSTNPSERLEVGESGKQSFEVKPATGYVSLLVDGQEVARMRQ